MTSLDIVKFIATEAEGRENTVTKSEHLFYFRTGLSPSTEATKAHL